MNEIIVNESNFQNEIEQSSKPVLIDFWATWCGPCRMLAPEIAEIAEKYEGKIKIAKINVDENEEIATKFKINNIPALFLVINNKIIKSSIGFMNKEEIESYFDLYNL